MTESIKRRDSVYFPRLVLQNPCVAISHPDPASAALRYYAISLYRHETAQNSLWLLKAE